VFLQSLLPAGAGKLALIGVGIVCCFYLLLGGRSYLLLGLPGQSADRLRLLAARAAGLKGSAHISRPDALLDAGHDAGRRGGDRQHRLGDGQSGVDAASRPDLRHRLAWAVLLAVFLFDLFVMRHGWCGHLCPVGAFYSLIGRFRWPGSSCRPAPPATTAWTASPSVPSPGHPAGAEGDRRHATPHPGSQLHQLRSLHRCLLEGCVRLRHPSRSTCR
jgi:hypothetical protein